MSFFLQLWGGSFFLFNKILFWQGERSKEPEHKRRARLWAWALYMLGLPAWLVIFAFERNWIAMSLEASGFPAMLLGFLIALRGKGAKPLWLDRLTFLGMGFGLFVSLYDFGGLTEFSQLLELGIALGYTVGIWLLAHEDRRGYLGFTLMNASNAGLMLLQGYPWLFVQQIISLFFVLDAYRRARHR